jgi:hypothetical protein
MWLLVYLTVNLPENNAHIGNIAYVRALFIKSTIESLKIETKEKEKIFNKMLEYLKNN